MLIYDEKSLRIRFLNTVYTTLNTVARRIVLTYTKSEKFEGLLFLIGKIHTTY